MEQCYQTLAQAFRALEEEGICSLAKKAGHHHGIGEHGTTAEYQKPCISELSHVALFEVFKRHVFDFLEDIAVVWLCRRGLMSVIGR
jgi:hypothetical protein